MFQCRYDTVSLSRFVSALPPTFSLSHVVVSTLHWLTPGLAVVVCAPFHGRGKDASIDNRVGMREGEAGVHNLLECPPCKSAARDA